MEPTATSGFKNAPLMKMKMSRPRLVEERPGARFSTLGHCSVEIAAALFFFFFNAGG